MSASRVVTAGLAAFVLIAAVVGCGRQEGAARAGSSPAVVSPAATSPAAASPAAAGNTPSESAKMICATEAQGDIQAALGVRPKQPLVPTWVDHLYSCRYVYPTGVLVLSVKELASAAATSAYYDGMRAKYPGGGEVPGIGEAAYIAPIGSVLVRKDFKVLWVDISGLPPQLGSPAVSRADAAYRVAVVVMGCWTGS
jgi:hypothetical protein